MIVGRQNRKGRLNAIAVCLVLFAGRLAWGQSPVVEAVFPAGGQAGQAVEVTISGSNLQGIGTLLSNIPNIRCERAEPNRFRLTIPAETVPGEYDLWGAGETGISPPRTFSVSQRTEIQELEPNDTVASINSVPTDIVINGRADKTGDVDQFRFDAKQGQRVVVECHAERIDSRLRAVLEIFDSNGRRLAVNRGYFGIDPLIDFHVPSDGSYVVRIQDLISAGSPEHYYRLDIDTRPRVAFAVPNVVQRGKDARVALYGWNLVTVGGGVAQAGVVPDLDRVEIEIPAKLAHETWPLPKRSNAEDVVLESFAYYLPGSHAATIIGVTDSPVVLDRAENHSPSTAQEIAIPCDVSGQLVAGEECDWFAFQARRGEVLYLEGFGQRIHSPVDLQVSIARRSTSGTSSKVLAAPTAGQQESADLEELVQFNDEVRSIGTAFPTSHLDPAGRWLCPADGQYLIAIRNLTGGLHADPRRRYRLSLRREEPDFQLVALPLRDGFSRLNVTRGGSEPLELLAFRRQGFTGPIRVFAKDLPVGMECPDIWLGPGVDRAIAVVSADRNAAPLNGELKLVGRSDTGDELNPRLANPGHAPELLSSLSRDREVRSGTVIRSGTPRGWGRLTSAIPISLAGSAPLRITANGHEPLEHQLYGKLKVRHSPGGILDVAVEIERTNTAHQAPVKLIGEGIPELIRNQTAIIPAGQHQGYLSFYLPPTLPLGQYSLTIRAETTVPTPDNKTATVAVFSNPVTFAVQSAAFTVEADPFAVTRAKRGEVIQVGYTAKRSHGFIGKMHTELAVPGHITDIPGLRGRGETFVGQTDKGTLQITINEDAPLGQQSFLRLFTVGVVEDEPIYHGSSFLSLEIVE